MKEHKIHPAWLILVACILFQAGTIGIMNNCMGLFYPSICEELNFKMGDISVFSTIMQIVMALSIPHTVLLLKRKRMKYYLLGALTVCCFGFGMMGTYTKLYQFYLNGAIMGIGGSLAFGSAVSVLIHNWFKDKKALAFGIAFAASGVSGAVFNPVCSNVILAVGWRNASWIMAGISALLTIPIMLLVVKRTPEEKGVLAYGEKKGGYGQKNPVNTARVTLLNPGVVLACCMSINFICCWLSQYLGHLVTFAKSLGASLLIGSAISSSSMAAFLFAQNNYEKNLGKMQSMGYLGSAVAFTVIGYSYDLFGSYTPSFIMAIILIAVTAVLAFVIKRNTRVEI